MRTVQRTVLIGVFCLGLSLSLSAADQPDITVTAVRAPKSTESTGRAVTTLTAHQIKEAGFSDVSEAVGRVSGLQTSHASGRGRFASIFMRGAETDHTLVMLNGVPINLDGGQVDLGWLDVDAVDRIEIVRGPISSIYGPEGLAGAINIITLSENEQPGISVRLGAGTLGEWRSSVHASGRSDDDKLVYKVGALYNTISDADFDNSDFERRLYHGHFLILPTPNGTIHASFRWNRDHFDVYTTGIGHRFSGEDPNDRQEQEDLVTAVSYAQSWSDASSTEVRWSRYDQNLEFFTVSDGVEDFFGDNVYEQNFTRDLVDVQQRWGEQDSTRFIVGYAHENEDGTQETRPGTPASDFRRYSDGTYLQVETKPVETVDLTGSIRYEDNSDFGSEMAGSVFSVYRMEATGTRLRAGWARGIKAPTFVEVAGFPSFGVTGLGDAAEEEESTSWEVGIDQPLLNQRASLGVTFFDSDIQNLVQFGPGSFTQTSSADIRGVETEGTFRLTPELWLSGNITWLDTEDDEGRELLRRAQWTYNAAIQYRPIEKFVTRLDVQGVGERDDTDFSTGMRVSNDAYARVGWSASYDVNNSWRVFTRADDLLDEQAEEVYGSPTDGLRAFVGVEFTKDI